MRALQQGLQWQVPSVAIAAFDRSGVLGFVGDPEQQFGWASVTKPVTALAVLVGIEEGTLSLEENAGPDGSTVAHLLAHASGLSPDDASAVLAKPGERRIYSNAGFEVLASILEARANMPVAEYLSSGVLAPLRMRSAVLEGSPARGMSGSLDDLLAFGRELLAPSIVAPSTLAMATTVAFPGLVGVLPGYGRQEPCDFGLGFEIKDHKVPHWTGERCSPQTFGHFGQSGTFIWIDPVAGLGCAGLSDRDFGPWAKVAWPALSDALLEEYEGRVGTVH